MQPLQLLFEGGARVLLINGNFDQCLRLVRDAAERLGVYLANSVNPWRVEGQKTIVFELLEQLGWDPPDWIALPAGNLGNASAFGKALREARELGLIERTPRLLLVQAEGAAPFARSAADAFRARVRVVEPNTVATAIRIGDPASYSRAVRVVRESGLPNRTDSMFTTIEGEWDQVFDVIRRATEAAGQYGSRVSLVLKADIRPGYTGELTGKLERLEQALQQ